MSIVPEDGADTFSFAEALRRERKAIWGADAARFETADKPKQAALCLSGGGIRSAAFCLGVMQALAGQNLLRHFHYLSTVSGGGYIGSWLQAWLLAHARQSGRSRIAPQDIQTVEALLGSGIAPQPVQQLRGFTSFLTPEQGLTSRDTWAAMTLYVRNVVVNWAIFMPALFALALLAGVYRDFLKAIPDSASPLVLAIALLAAGLAAFFPCCHLPSHATGKPPEYASVASIGRYSVVPALIWSALLPLAMAPFLLTTAARNGSALAIGTWGPTHIVPLAVFVLYLLAYLAAWGWCAIIGHARRLYAANLLPWIIGCGIACGVLAGCIRLAGMLLPGSAIAPALLAIVGPAAVILSHLCMSLAFVALRREVLRGDLDREWLARLSAIKFVPVLLWGILAAVCMLLTPAVLRASGSAIWTWGCAAVTAASGGSGALLGHSKKSSGLAGTGLLSFDTLAALLTMIFAVGLLTLLATAGDALLAWLVAPDSAGTTGAAGLALAALCLGIAWVLGRCVNVNRFSLHGLYRNRLIRAFLGTVRPPTGRLRRVADPFTDFDPADNVRMQELQPEPHETRRLFPVIGTALNLESGEPRAWQERKAAPFSITPVACGSAILSPPNAFAATAIYAGSEPETGLPDEPMGMTVGTAMALSGAAVSPSMGYHSSPWTAFLMTLFNVRLGGWLPNPAIVRGPGLRNGKPPNALLALAAEMLGLAGGTGSAIYLTDGGHFDNLGLYEMIRRGCNLIVVVDAGADPGYAFADLASAVREIRIDMNVEITFPMPMPMTSEKKWTPQSGPYALAKITWRDPPATGHLLYVKPCRLPAMPVDVRGYASQDRAFPNDSTLDQFFTESQFESYRKLGRWIGERAAADPALAPFLQEIFTV